MVSEINPLHLLEAHGFFILAFGILVLRLRVRPARFLKATPPLNLSTHEWTLTTEARSWLSELAIIIPARNEASNLPRLLRSLKPLQLMGSTILVVDDQSTDDTARVAESEGATVLRNKLKPEDWSGKNWACYQGAQELLRRGFSGKFILFTDADTEHQVQNLPTALEWFQQQNLQLLTARPFHRNPQYWERFLGPFQLMVLMITDAFQSIPRQERFFSIGQYLLFDRQYYFASGGHEPIRQELAEDLALTRLCFQASKRFMVYPQTNLYSTRMYATVAEFFKGWQRNFRLGMAHSSPWTWAESIIVIGGTLAPTSWVHYVLFAFLFLWKQRGQGHYSILGALFFPIGLLVFVIISFKAQWSSLIQKPILWKERSYSTK